MPRWPSASSVSGCRTASAPTQLPAAEIWISPVAFVVAGLIIYWSGFNVIWKLGVCLVIGYVLIAICMVFDPERPPLDWKSAAAGCRST